MKTITLLFIVSISSVSYGQVIRNNASTVQESYARGRADVLRAMGQQNLSNSVAAINYQDAYARSIDNKTKKIQAFWERRAIYNYHLNKKLAKIAARRQRKLARLRRERKEAQN